MILYLLFYIMFIIIMTAQEAQLLNERILILEKELSSTRDEIKTIEDRNNVLEENIVPGKKPRRQYRCGKRQVAK